jgi:predicted nucleic acid-binding protein
MLLCDVNILVYAFREDAPDHEQHRDWLAGVISSASAFGLSDYVLSGFLSVVTHPRIFKPPTPMAVALQFPDYPAIFMQDPTDTPDESP